MPGAFGNAAGVSGVLAAMPGALSILDDHSSGVQRPDSGVTGGVRHSGAVVVDMPGRYAPTQALMLAGDGADTCFMSDSTAHLKNKMTKVEDVSELSLWVNMETAA